VNIVDKPWGWEEIIVLNDKYCLKRLHIKKGERLSLQYHTQKKETMILEDGRCDVLVNDIIHTMVENEVLTINPMDIHRVIAYEDSIILEVSTPEVDDIVRIEDHYGRVRKKG